MVAILAGCSPGSPQSSDEPLALATVSPITSLVSDIAGGEIQVRGIIPEGVDSHTFDPSPRDVSSISQADVIFMNGLNLELPTKRLAASNSQARIVELARSAVQPDEWIYDHDFPEGKGDPNPHLWTNPLYAMEFCDEILEELIRLDPSAAEIFTKNHRSLVDKIKQLDSAIRTASASLPVEARKLLTYHDSFPYFAREYGWTVIGAIQPSDFSEPSPKAVADLIEQIKREKVPAIFGSEVFSSSVLEQIARATGARYVADLRDDDLPGDPGDPEHTYLGMMKMNVVTMVESLGGDASALKAIDARPLNP